MLRRGRLDPKAIVLIQNMREHPQLYSSDFQQSNMLPRSEKQRLWDQIAKRSGFNKTEDAKCKWRTLLINMRQHLEDVLKKKQRRYIPKTGNPDDKYVQKTDWRYYEYMSFIEPYLKITYHVQSGSSTSSSNTGCAMQALAVQGTTYGEMTIPKATTTHTPKTTIGTNTATTPIKTTSTVTAITQGQAVPNASTPMWFKIGDVVVQVEVDNKKEVKAPDGSTTADYSRIKPSSICAIEALNQLNTRDQNLKAFFDAMLRSTHCLPLFHQERVKKKLENVIKSLQES